MIDRALGSSVVAGAFARWLDAPLRVIAYHGVDDPSAFDAQIRHVAECWQPVTSDQVIEAVTDPASLPDRAVWLTFDDGLRSTVTRGRQVLDRYGIKATVFVNPGVFGRWQWWKAVDAVGGVDGVRAAKLLEDSARREVVQRAAATLDEQTLSHFADESASIEDLREWIEHGHTIGNHTWDHPCLDRCPEDEQLRQVEQAAGTLEDAGLMPRRLFAYPNGNRSEPVDRHLRERDYELALLFDHRVASLEDRLAVSRLRIDSASPIARFRAILSGAHPAAMHLRNRVRRSVQSS